LGVRRASPGMQLGSADCERIRDGGLAQPVNAVTSLAYAAASLAVLRRLAKKPAPARLLLTAQSVALLAASAGSVSYHGIQHKYAQRWHDVSMAIAVVATGLVVIHGVTRHDLSPARIRRLLLLAVAAVAAYGGGRTESPLCRPDSILQLHAMWHVLSASVSVVAADTP
jgi:hypothetical protein